MVSRTAIELEAFPMWLRSLFRHFGAGRNDTRPNRIRARSPRRRPAWLPCLESLEDRTVPSCFTFEQITQIHHHPQILEELDPAISGDGTRIAFQSFADLTGENADGTDEIFLFDTVTSRLTQVTQASERFVHGIPSINGDGSRLAFRSFADLTGENADGNSEIFLFDAGSNTLTQITHSKSGEFEPRDSFGPSISGDGTRITFMSFADLTGGNADGNQEIFLFDTETGAFTQVTHTITTADHLVHTDTPVITAEGNRVAFLSQANMTGRNADENFELFLFDIETGTLTQITETEARSVGFPSLSAVGTRIAFNSNADLTGENAEGQGQLFLFDTVTGGFTQVTKTTGGVLSTPSISGDGTRIAFQSFRDLTGENADGNSEVFLFDTATSTFTQITDTSGGTFSPLFTPLLSISGDGTRIAFQSHQDLTGENAQGDQQIFVAVILPNSPPENTVPGAQETAEDVALVFSPAHGNALSVSDPDAGTEDVQVTLTVTHGTLTVSQTAGLSFSFSDVNGTGQGDGTADAAMTFRGSVAAVNAALAGLIYKPAHDFNGEATLTVTTKDLCHTGLGGVMSDTDVVAITVRSPQEQVKDLGEQIDDLVSGGALNSGQGHALKTKLQGALDKIAKGQIGAAVNQLNAFIQQVNAYVAAGILSDDEGDVLIDAANDLLTSIAT
jgi:Tol biopolymer transport system component